MQVSLNLSRQSRLFFIIPLYLVFSIVGESQSISGYAWNLDTKQPVGDVRVSMKNTNLETFTNEYGYFEFSEQLIKNEFYENSLTNFKISGTRILVEIPDAKIAIYNMLGSIIEENSNGILSHDFNNSSGGMYIMSIHKDNISQIVKIMANDKHVLFDHKSILNTIQYELLFEKDNYYTDSIFARPNEAIHLYLLSKEVTDQSNYTKRIIKKSDYDILAGNPLNLSFSDVTSLKFVYETNTKDIYYINTRKFTNHFSFCRDAIGYTEPLYIFNAEQYRNNPNRIYYLGSVDYFASSDIYGIMIFPIDDIECEQVEILYNKIKETSYFGDRLFLVPNDGERGDCTEFPVIAMDDLMNGQNYQCLNSGVTYGYLRKIPIENLKDTYLGKHDIVLTNGIPLDMPVVSGIITTTFQPVLSHINVLSHNRGTPNLAIRDGWENDSILKYENMLVCLNASLKGYSIREAGLKEAQSFWNEKEPTKPFVLEPDLAYSSFLDANDMDIKKVNIVGGKAANFGELNKVSVNGQKLNIPEGAFAIPFYYYQMHIQKYGLDAFIDRMLDDSIFYNNTEKRKKILETLRDSIENSPLDPEFYIMVLDKLNSYDFVNFRFRSSTNAEDIEGFNGAGLYDSKTGIPNDKDKPVDKAIKKVWSSLWNFSAFEERAYFRIDQQSVAMGILVHRSFRDEVANGVVITKNIYNPLLTGFTINSQFGEISVVNPEEGYLPEQVLYYDYENAIEYISYSNVPFMPTKFVLTRQDLVSLAASCQAIIGHYYDLGLTNTLDIEFKVVENDMTGRKIFVKQCRSYGQ